MDAEEIKDIILNDGSVISKILEDLGMHHIQLHNNCYTFGLPDGDNPSSTSLYLDDLGVKAYTREDKHITDIIDLVIYVQTINKTVEKPNCWSAVIWLCEELGLKRLAYEVQKQKNGYYVIFEIKATPENIKNLERFYRINDDVLKFIVVRKED